MSLWPRFQEVSPMFRLMDDYERAIRRGFPEVERAFTSNVRGFAPKFDVKELKGTYELHGELPGIAQKDISIEWTDGNTLTISGRTESRSESGEPPRGFVEGEEDSSKKYQKPTVEDEASPSTEVATANANKEVAKQEDAPRFWVTERCVGEFHRSFSFPTRVDQDNVKASLKDGILSIIVPKAQAPKPRKINID